MIQRLLRSRWLYVMMAGVMGLIYVRALCLHRVKGLEKTPAPSAETLEWWPSALDETSLKEAMARQPHLRIMLGALAACVGGLGLGGVALSLWGLWGGGMRAVWRVASRRLPSWSFGELWRITLLVLAIASSLPFVHFALLSTWIGARPDPNLWTVSSMILLDTFVILAILTFAMGKRQRLWRALGLSVRRLSSSIAVGLRGYVAIFPWLFVLLALTLQAARLLGLKPPAEPIQELIFQEDRAGVLALTVLLACLIGPLAEELFFRGVLYTAIRQRSSRLLATLVSGAAFALLHTNILGFLSIMLLGCLLAYLYERTGSLLSPLAVHILHNTLLMSLALVFRQLMS